ncbi:MAG: hypothetical protein H6707_01940 [Deltaproteobacteria bacterium]|nr:hypothetical protein [Deltaproteobacteria bacterium]
MNSRRRHQTCGVLVGICVLVSSACANTDFVNGADGGAPDTRGIGTLDAAPIQQQRAELWYAIESTLVHIELNGAQEISTGPTGYVKDIHTSTITPSLSVGHNSLVVLDDGSLLGARLSIPEHDTQFYHIAQPPRDGSPVTAKIIGLMPDNIRIEAMHVDCKGRVYVMDTGVHDGTPEGNRLLRFTGDIVAGDFSFEVINSLENAPDIDDMGPGVVDGEITDNPGFAIDSGDIYDFNYQQGTGKRVGSGGTWGIHALGRQMFSDDKARIYVLSQDGELYWVDPVTMIRSSRLETGPKAINGYDGWSGLAGPLSSCKSGFIVE